MSDPAALTPKIVDLLARCKAMERCPARSKLELELGELLLRQDAMILQISKEPEPCPT